MKFRMMKFNPVEKFAANEFEVERRVKSVVIPHRMIKYKVFYCPNCGEETDRPGHGEQIKCKHCELWMLVYGNALYVSWGEIQEERMR